MTGNKRFIALGSTHLKDSETGEEFYAPCEWELLDLLNNLHEQLEPIQKICEKYNIKLKDLPATLEEYVADDNDGYAGYSKCDGCKYDFEVDE